MSTASTPSSATATATCGSARCGTGSTACRLPPGQAGPRLQGTLTPYTTAEGLSDNSVLALPEDRRRRRVGGHARRRPEPRGRRPHHLPHHARRPPQRLRLCAAPGRRRRALGRDVRGRAWRAWRTTGGSSSPPSTGSSTTSSTAWWRTRAGDLWLTCNRGIFRVSRAELDERGRGAAARPVSSTAFGLPDGMRSVECNAGGAARRPGDATAGCGSRPCAARWRSTPPGCGATTLAPPVHIEAVRWGTRVLEGAGGRDAGRAAGGHPSSSTTRRSACARPSRVRFRYRLEGLDRGLDGGGDAAGRLLQPGAARAVCVPGGGRATTTACGTRWARAWGCPVRRPLLRDALVPRPAGRLAWAAQRGRRTVSACATCGARGELVAAGGGADRGAARLGGAEAQRARRGGRAGQPGQERVPGQHEPRAAHAAQRDPRLRPAHAAARPRATAADRENLAIIGAQRRAPARPHQRRPLAVQDRGRAAHARRAAPSTCAACWPAVEDMFRAARRAQGACGLELRVDAALPRHVRGDEGKLRQVLLNLLGNAVKFTRARGR